MFDFDLSDSLRQMLTELERRDKSLAEAVKKKIREVVSRDLKTIDFYKNLRKPLQESLRRRGWTLPTEEELRRRITAARESRPRESGGREERREGRDGVAGMSLGQGPRPIEELDEQA